MEIAKTNFEKNPEDGPKSKSIQPTAKPIFETEIFDKVVDGLYQALRVKKTPTICISNADMYAFSNIEEDTFDYFYKNADGVLKDIQKKVCESIQDLATVYPRNNETVLYKMLFQRLGEQPDRVRVLIALDGSYVWQQALQPLKPVITHSWTGAPSDIVQYLFRSFSSQFGSILEKWEKVDFCRDYLDDCVRLMTLWIDLDEIMGNSFDRVLGKWKNL